MAEEVPIAVDLRHSVDIRVCGSLQMEDGGLDRAGTVYLIAKDRRIEEVDCSTVSMENDGVI
jgi:hypothetical protein